MSILTATQLSDVRADIGDATAPYAFSDADLQRLYTRAVADGYGETAVRAYALRQLLTSAAKFHDYTAGSTRVQKRQVFQNLQQILAYWEGVAGISGDAIAVGTGSLGLDQDASTTLTSRISEWIG